MKVEKPDKAHARTLKSLSAQDVIKLTTLALVSRTLSTSYCLEEGIDSILGEIMSALDAERGFVQLFDGEGQSQIIISEDESVSPPQESFQYSQTLVDQCRNDRLPILVFDAIQTSATQSAISTGMRSVMIHPIFRQANLVGIIYLDCLLKSGRFRENELKLLGVIADMVSVYLERIYNAEALKKALEELRASKGESALAPHP